MVHGACKWVLGSTSQLLFGFDNLLGYVIAERVTLAPALYKDNMMHVF